MNEDVSDHHLSAIDARARGLSAIVQGAHEVFAFVGHPCVDHVRVLRSGPCFEVQVVSHVGLSLSPIAFDDDSTWAFTAAWRVDETGGHFVLDAEAVAILAIAIERETGD